MAAKGLLRRFAPLAAAAFVAMAAAQPAAAQGIAAVVNGDPITTSEIEEQMRLLRVMRQPADRNAAIEALVADRIKLRAANRGGIDASDAGFAQALNSTAKKAGMTSQVFQAELQRGKISIDFIKNYLRAVAAWNDFVKSRYKAMAVSESEVDAAIRKDASLGRGDTDYTLQQIVFVVPVNASPAVLEQRQREAQALRARFQDCASGVPLARALPDVAVKPPVVKEAKALSEVVRKAFEGMQRGRLTPPERSATGFEMTAVCSKADDNNQSSVRDGVQADLLTQRLSKEADRMYAELRARAVVEKR